MVQGTEFADIVEEEAREVVKWVRQNSQRHSGKYATPRLRRASPVKPAS